MHEPTPEPQAPRRAALALLRYFPHGGLQRIAWEVAEELHRRGLQVTLFTQDWQGPKPSPQDGESHTWEVRVLDVRGRSNHGRAEDFSAQLQTELRQDPHDITLGFDRLGGLDFYFAGDPCYSARLRRSRTWAHRWMPRSRAFLRLERSVFGPESSTRTLLMNGAEQAVIQQEYGTPAERLRALPPGYSPSRRQGPSHAEERATIRAEVDAEGAVLALALGSDFHRKGFDRAITALRSATKADPARRYLLAIAGSGRSAKLRALADKLGVAEQVRWLGARDDVRALLQGADLLLHPCRSEPAGMVLLEALSAGTPVIVSSCAGYAVHVENSGAGAVLPEPFQQGDLDRALVQIGGAAPGPLQDHALRYTAGPDSGPHPGLDPKGMVHAVADEIQRAAQGG